MTIKRLSCNGLLILALSLAGAGLAAGSEFAGGETVHITNMHSIEDDLYVGGSNVRIDGYIDGDLVAGGYEVRTSGEVSGSQNIAAFSHIHTGRCRGSLRVLAATATIEGLVERSAVLLGNEIVVGNGAVIKRDCTIGAAIARIDGEVRGELSVNAEKIALSGKVGGDAFLEADKIELVPPAVIEGNLTYTSPEELVLDSLGGVTVLGTVTRKELALEDSGVKAFRTTVLSISKWLAAFLFGIILMHLFRRQAEESVRQLHRRFSVSLAAGVLMTLLSALSLLALMLFLGLTVAGLSLVSGDAALVGAIMLVFSIVMVPMTAFAAVCGGILFYIGKVVLGALIGFGLFTLVRPGAPLLGKMQMLIGLIVLYAVFALPYVGFAVYLLTGMAGAGAVVLGVRHCLHIDREQQSPAGE